MSAAPLSEEEITEALALLPGWVRDRESLRLETTFADFREALRFLVGVGLCAEARGHHPEIFNVYNRVTLRLSTHDAGDVITGKDTQLAGDILDLLPGTSQSDN